MVDSSRVSVSIDGRWVFDGYRWWPIEQVPVGTQTSAGYVWNGANWDPPPAAPTWKYGILGGIALAVAVGLVFVLIGNLL